MITKLIQLLVDRFRLRRASVHANRAEAARELSLGWLQATGTPWQDSLQTWVQRHTGGIAVAVLVVAWVALG